MNFNEALKRLENGGDLAALAHGLLAQMTTKEKLYMVGGHHNRLRDLVKHGRAYNAEPIHASGCKRLGIPQLRFADGPRGIVCAHNTCFPVPMARGASFDRALERRVGEAIGLEAVGEDANFFGGVCINLLRHPAWGRAQESYGEDSFLLGEMGAALTAGVQQSGVMACAKHFALNSIENLRFKVDVTASERTLREVYLPHFKACVDAGAASVMGAYNKFAGDHCCESETLLTRILKDEWGFAGYTISDFTFGVRNGKKAMKSGLNVEMPNTSHYGRELRDYVKSDPEAMQYLDRAVLEILQAFLRFTPKYNETRKKTPTPNRTRHALLAREAAEKSMVLLKNDGTLPLDIQKLRTLAVVGRFADTTNIGDRGSSSVFPAYTVSPFAGIADYCKENAPGKVKLLCAANDKDAYLAAKQADAVVVAVGLDYKDEGEYTPNFDYDTGVTLAGDRKTLRIRKSDARLIQRLRKINPNIIVTLSCGSALLIDEWETSAAAILLMWYSGMEGGNALARLLFGESNPGGRLPFSIAQTEADYPPFLYGGGKHPTIKYDYYHGYTLLDKKGKTAAYPFGFGLSYTTFAHSDLRAEKLADCVRVSFTLKNTGNRPGSEVSQLYFGSAGSVFDRPVKLLKGFAKTELAAGEARKISVDIPLERLGFYHNERKKFENDRAYHIYLSGDGKRFLQTDIKL